VDFPICLAKDSPKGTRKMERPISIMITITPIEAHIKSSLTPQPENTERAAGNGRICGQTPFFFSFLRLNQTPLISKVICTLPNL